MNRIIIISIIFLLNIANIESCMLKIEYKAGRALSNYHGTKLMYIQTNSLYSLVDIAKVPSTIFNPAEPAGCGLMFNFSRVGYSDYYRKMLIVYKPCKEIAEIINNNCKDK